MIIRPATADDVPSIVALLADDRLGSTREDLTDLAPYLDAFVVIAADPHQRLVVAVDESDPRRVVGTLQLTIIPGLSRRASTRAQIEAVRVGEAARGSGFGTELIEWAIAQARSLGCGLVQLTTDRSRTDAHRFYERLGFEPTHLGLKLVLPV